MAPGYHYGYGPYATTPVAIQRLDAWEMQVRRWEHEVKQKQQKETKKEKIARLAKEKMYASWKTRDQLEPDKPKVFQLRQICKPRHRINFIHR